MQTRDRRGRREGRTWLAGAGMLLLALAAGGGLRAARAELVLSSEQSWATETPALDDEVVEYLLCDAAGSCRIQGVGDRSRAGAPVRLGSLEPGVRTLRVRFCIASAPGVSSGDCGPLSGPSAPFRVDPSLTRTRFVSIDGDQTGAYVRLSSGQEHLARLPLGIAPPVSSPVLRLGLAGTFAELQVTARGTRDPGRVYLDAPLLFTGSASETTVDFPGLRDAVARGEPALELRVRVVSGEVDLGLRDPVPLSSQPAPHVTGQTLFGVLATVFDPDRDGVPLLLSSESPLCSTGQWLGCSDNCPDTANVGQGDLDGDGVGDACAPGP